MSGGLVERCWVAPYGNLMWNGGSSESNDERSFFRLTAVVSMWPLYRDQLRLSKISGRIATAKSPLLARGLEELQMQLRL